MMDQGFQTHFHFGPNQVKQYPYEYLWRINKWMLCGSSDSAGTLAFVLSGLSKQRSSPTFTETVPFCSFSSTSSIYCRGSASFLFLTAICNSGSSGQLSWVCFITGLKFTWLISNLCLAWRVSPRSILFPSQWRKGEVGNIPTSILALVTG